MTSATWRWVAAAALLMVASVWIFVYVAESEMLRVDPDVLPSRHKLVSLALAAGSLHYGAHCVACHGASGEGDPAKGVPDLTDRDWLYGSGRVSEIERVIEHGIRSHDPQAWNLAQMPAFGRAVPSAAEPKIPPLTPAEIRDLVEYIRHVGGARADEAAAARGSFLYHDRGGCYDCHGQDGSGDNAIGAPNLTDEIWLYGDGSRASVFDSIARGHAGVCPAWIRRLSPAAIRETAIYVYSLSHPEVKR